MIPFEDLMKLAPKESSELDVLKVITSFASLVQGCWVANSDLRYKAPMTLFRDYILLLFSKNQVIKHEQLRGLPISKEQLREIMTPIAVQRGGVSWEFQVGDLPLHLYPAIDVDIPMFAVLLIVSKGICDKTLWYTCSFLVSFYTVHTTF